MANSQRFLSSLLGVALIAVLVLMGNSAGLAYERTVLIEDYTNTSCGPCATWTPYVLRGLENFESGTNYALVAPHVWWPSAQDPWWVNNDECQPRPGYCGFNGVPAFYCDGEQLSLGGGLENETIEAVGNRLEVDSPLDMRITFRINEDENLLNTTVYITSDEDLNNLDLFFVVGERIVAFRSANGQQEHHGPTVDWLDDGNGTRFDIEADQTLEFDFESDFEYDVNGHEVDYDDNLYLCAWVANSDIEVLQASYNPFEIATAFFAFDGVDIHDEQDGNGDGRVEPGETAQVVISITNNEDYLPAESTEIVMTTDDENIEIITGTVDFGGIENGQAANNGATPFSFSVAENVIPHEATLTFTLSSQPGDLEQVMRTNIIIGWPDVLVMDASNNPDATEYMMSVFDTGGEKGFAYAEMWDRTNMGELPENYAPHFKTIIYHSFNADVDLLSEAEEASLVSFLDGGGNLIMSGTYLASTLPLDNTLYADYLKISMETENLRRGAQIIGVEGDDAFGETSLYVGGGALGNATRKTSINALDGGEAVLLYDNGDLNIAAVKHEAGDYRTLFLSFPIECIAGRLNTDSLSQFMAQIKTWHDNPPNSVDDETVAPNVFQLEPAFPNPFNSTVTVPFSLDQAGQATLTLFDMSGRQVAKIFEGAVTTGHQTVAFDASTIGLTSGVYYLQLSANERTQGQKLLYLR